MHKAAERIDNQLWLFEQLYWDVYIGGQVLRVAPSLSLKAPPSGRGRALFWAARLSTARWIVRRPELACPEPRGFFFDP